MKKKPKKKKKFNMIKELLEIAKGLKELKLKQMQQHIQTPRFRP